MMDIGFDAPNTLSCHYPIYAGITQKGFVIYGKNCAIPGIGNSMYICVLSIHEAIQLTIC